MLDDLLESRDASILTNPNYRLNIVVVKSHGLLADDHRGRLGVGLSSVITDNLIGRARLARHFERIILHDARSAPPLEPLTNFPSRYLPLANENLRHALLASGSIPMVMEGVRDIPGAGAGTYRDGGLLDYHLDLPYSGDDIVLYPHFTDKVVPGWFDKALPWRRGDACRLSLVACRLSLVACRMCFYWRRPGNTWPACPTANFRTAATSSALWAMRDRGSATGIQR